MSFSICKTLTMSCVNGGNRKRDKRVNGEGSGDLRHSRLAPRLGFELERHVQDWL